MTAKRLDSLTNPSSRDNTATFASSSHSSDDFGGNGIERDSRLSSWTRKASRDEPALSASKIAGDTTWVPALLDLTCTFFWCGLFLGSTGQWGAIWPTQAHRRQMIWWRHFAVWWVFLKQCPHEGFFGDLGLFAPVSKGYLRGWFTLLRFSKRLEEGNSLDYEELATCAYDIPICLRFEPPDRRRRGRTSRKIYWSSLTSTTATATGDPPKVL